MLVDRAQGGLTDDGARVVERARRILRELDDIAADVAPVTGDVTGDVRLGMLGTTARWLLPDLLPTLSRLHPHIRAIVSDGSTSVLLPALLAAGSTPRSCTSPSTIPSSRSNHCSPRSCSSSPPPIIASPAGTRSLSPSSPRTTSCLPPSGSALRRVLDRAAASVGRPTTRPGRDRRGASARRSGGRRPRPGDRPRHRGLSWKRRRFRFGQGPRARPSRRGARLPAPARAERAGASVVRGASGRRVGAVLRISPACGSAPMRSRSAVRSDRLRQSAVTMLGSSARSSTTRPSSRSNSASAASRASPTQRRHDLLDVDAKRRSATRIAVDSGRPEAFERPRRDRRLDEPMAPVIERVVARPTDGRLREADRAGAGAPIRSTRPPPPWRPRGSRSSGR